MHVSSSLLLLPLLLLFLSDLDCMLLCYFSPVASSFYSLPPVVICNCAPRRCVYAHLEREGQILSGYRRRSRIRLTKKSSVEKLISDRVKIGIARERRLYSMLCYFGGESGA